MYLRKLVALAGQRDLLSWVEGQIGTLVTRASLIAEYITEESV